MTTIEAPKRASDTAGRKADRNGARAQKSSARREAILAAALDEFSAQGFAATRLDDVARRAGVAKGTIYLYFKDKESLFQELVASVFGVRTEPCVNRSTLRRQLIISTRF